MPTLTKTKPETIRGERRPTQMAAERPVKPVTVADDMAELRRIIGFPGGQGSLIVREE